MFFPHLKNFSPYSGHIYNEMRSGIIRKNGELISKDDNRFDLIKRLGYFPFRELRRNDNAYFISDLELFDFFQATEQQLNDYHVEAYPNWGFQAKEQLLKVFLVGYQNGLNSFMENIGISYNTQMLADLPKHNSIPNNIVMNIGKQVAGGAFEGIGQMLDTVGKVSANLLEILLTPESNIAPDINPMEEAEKRRIRRMNRQQSQGLRW